MRLLPWFLVPAAAALAVGLWWSARRGPLPEVPVPVAAQGPQGGVPQPVPAERRPPSEAPQVVEALEPEPATMFGQLEAEYRQVQGKSIEDERRVMRDLVACGTEGAYQFIVDQLEHTGTLLSNGDDRQRCEAAWSILNPVHDSPVVFRFALSAIDDARSRGVFTAALGGYHRLAAQNGGEAAAKFLLGELDAAPEFALSAARAIGSLTDRSLSEQYLARALGPVAVGVDERALRSEIVRALTAWSDSDLAVRLDDMVFDDLRELEQRLTLLSGLGGTWNRQMVERTCQLFDQLEGRVGDAGAARLREKLVTSWTRLKNPFFDDAACTDLLGPIVRRGLVVGDGSTLALERFRGALRLLEAHPVLRDAGVLGTLRGWLDADPTTLPAHVVESRSRLVGLVGPQ